VEKGQSQKPVKINADLWDELTKFLKTKKAKELRYFSRAQFATEAIRENLERIKRGEKDELTKQIAEHFQKSGYNKVMQQLQKFLKEKGP